MFGGRKFNDTQFDERQLSQTGLSQKQDAHGSNRILAACARSISIFADKSIFIKDVGQWQTEVSVALQ